MAMRIGSTTRPFCHVSWILTIGLRSGAQTAHLLPAQPRPVLRSEHASRTASAQILEIEGLGKTKVELEGKWQYHPGDDPQWADPRLDDASWPQVDVGSLFDQGVNYSPFFGTAAAS